jgi:hypothetical protein
LWAALAAEALRKTTFDGHPERGASAQQTPSLKGHGFSRAEKDLVVGGFSRWESKARFQSFQLPLLS